MCIYINIYVYVFISVYLKDNAAKMLNIILQRSFVSKNVVNLSRRNLTCSEICSQKGLIFFSVLVQ